MLRLFSTRSYREQVNEIYKLLERDGWSNLKRFEYRIRKINLLNHKIKCLAADMGKPEGKYDTL